MDPRRDISPYIETADGHGLTIEMVLETPFHADQGIENPPYGVLTGDTLFVAAVTDQQTAPPACFSYDTGLNRELHGLLDDSRSASMRWRGSSAEVLWSSTRETRTTSASAT